MILLDTNVVSEMMKAAPDRRALAWLDAQLASALFVSSITQSELLYGVALSPGGKRRDELARAVGAAFAVYFRGRVLAFDSAAAAAFADIAASRRRAGRPISQSDAQIAAIARSRGATLATRNVKDFDGCGVEVVDPWAER